ncbi:MAG TPA: glycosyltransferase [Candidatus Mediterraneibacter excrementigallinarum]|nr:glycosyltransferase [Candidatus Mediterraneibacter excrementigallinarum]
MAKVSIIVPTYNVEQYLTQCMESIVGQTLKELEIICVNDGSTDGSLGILRKYEQKDDRVIVIDKKNEGYGCAMNDGLDRATGEYIGIVEPDDFVDLHMYEDLYNIAKEKDLDIVKADFYRFICNKKGEFLKTYEALSKDGTGYNMVIDPKENDGIFRYILNTWSGIYRRSFIEKYHIRHNTTPGASFQDNGFWFQTFCLAKRVYFVNRPYYMNRRDNPNSSVKSRKKVYCMNEEYRFIHDFLDRHPELKPYFIKVYSMQRFRNYFTTYNRIDRKFRKEYLKTMSEELREADRKNELDQKYFTPFEWKKIVKIMKDPSSAGVWMAVSTSARRMKQSIRNLRRVVNGKRI